MAALAPVRYPVVVGVIAFGILNPDPAYAPTFQTAPEDRPSVLERAGETGLAAAIGAAGIKLGQVELAIEGAGTRVNQIHGTLDARAARSRTTAVTETAEGTRIVSSSERRLTPAQRAALRPGEVEAAGVGHAEVTGVNRAREMGLTPTGTAASRPICPECANFLNRQGVTPLSPLK